MFTFMLIMIIVVIISRLTLQLNCMQMKIQQCAWYEKSKKIAIELEDDL